MNLTCCTCKETKDEGEFHRSRSTTRGYMYKCKLCAKAYDKANSDMRKKIVAKSKKKRQELFGEQDKAKRREQYKENASVVRASHRKYREANLERQMLWKAKDRAANRGLAFEIELSDILIPQTCPVLGIALQYNKGKRADNSPSLDRIDNSKGYVKGNIHVVSDRVNRIKADATVAELEMIYNYFKGIGGIEA